jgi:hypothetical protein
MVVDTLVASRAGRPTSLLLFSFINLAYAALIMAAGNMPWALAIQTNTAIVVEQDGKIVRIPAAELIKQGHTKITS